MRLTLLRFVGLLCLILLAAACGSDSPTSDEPAGQVPEPGSGGLVSFFGRIDDIGSSHVTVAGRVFAVDGDTHVFVQQNEVRFSNLHVGDLVVVRAHQNRSGTWVAREIKVRVDSPPEVKLTGRVDSIVPPELKVAGRLVVTGPDTSFLGVGDPRSLRDVRVGDLVTVTGFESSTGVTQATKIRVESRG
jgi:hypothetical protein